MRKPSPSLIVACLALFFSLGGGAYAASRVLITNVHQIGPGVRHELRGRRGPAGPRGPAGSQSPQGQAAAAPPVLPTTYQVTSSATLTAASANVSLIEACKSGDTVLSGGFSGNGEIVTASEQTNTNTNVPAWIVTAHLDPNYSPGVGKDGTPPPAAQVNAQVICTRA